MFRSCALNGAWIAQYLTSLPVLKAVHLGRNRPEMKALRHVLFLIAAIPFRTWGQQPVDPAFAAALQAKIDSCVNVYALPGSPLVFFFPKIGTGVVLQVWRIGTRCNPWIPAFCSSKPA